MILKKALSLLETIKENKYSGKNLIDTENGIYECNCSGIILYILNQLGIRVAHKRAYEIFDYLKSSEHFVKIESFSKLKPGDLIIWKKNNIPKIGSSGHICILVNKLEGNRVRVFDCVKLKHDNDSRLENGIGLGDFELILKDDRPIGFVWSSLKRKTKLTEVLMVRAKN